MYEDAYKHITHLFAFSFTSKETGVHTGDDGEEDEAHNRKGGEW